MPSRFSEPSTACADVLGPAADAAVLARLESISKPNLVAITTWSRNGRERLADELLVLERAIDLGGVEEGNAALHRGPDKPDAILLGQVRGIAEADAHAAKPDG